jgi:hypothetical protein
MSMKKMQIGAIVLTALVGVPIQASMAQSPQVAYASESRPGYVVFFDKGAARLSGVAAETIRSAAIYADSSAGPIRVVGRDDYAAVVKAKLVRDGVPARSVIVAPPRADNPLPAIADGVGDPSERRVEIHY